MTPRIYPSNRVTDPALSIEGLNLSIRTYNRLSQINVGNLEQIAQTVPSRLLAIKGFGKGCLYELSAILEHFYSSLDARQLARFANIVELWRPYFSHPERIPVVTYDPTPLEPAKSGSSNADARVGQSQDFEPASDARAQVVLENLPISTRSRNVLRKARIRTLNDLASISPRMLMKSKNCGRKTIAELAALLNVYFASLPTSALKLYRDTGSAWLRHAPSSVDSNPSLPDFTQPQDQSLTEIIEGAVAKLTRRTASILTSRLGLVPSVPSKTLEAIGREFHLTRERVRQIADKGLKTVLRNVKINCPDLIQNIKKIIRTSGLVTVEELAKAIPNLGTSSHFDPHACLRLLLFASQPEIDSVHIGWHLWGCGDITPHFYREVLKKARAVIKGIPTPCPTVSVEVAKAMHQFENRQVETIQKILLNSRGEFRIEPTSQGEVLHPLHQTSVEQRRAFAYSYIKEQGVPIHIRELFSAMQESEPELIPNLASQKDAIRAINTTLGRDEKFAWAGSSTWGLREWGYLSTGGTIATAILGILRASEIPLSSAEITKEILLLYRVSSAGIRAALKSSEGVTIQKTSQGLWHPL